MFFSNLFLIIHNKPTDYFHTAHLARRSPPPAQRVPKAGRLLRRRHAREVHSSTGSPLTLSSEIYIFFQNCYVSRKFIFHVNRFQSTGLSDFSLQRKNLYN